MAAGRAVAAVPTGVGSDPAASDMSWVTRLAKGCWEAGERELDRDGKATMRVRVRDRDFAAPFLTGVQAVSSEVCSSLSEDATMRAESGCDWGPLESCDRSLLATGVAGVVGLRFGGTSTDWVQSESKLRRAALRLSALMSAKELGLSGA